MKKHTALKLSTFSFSLVFVLMFGFSQAFAQAAQPDELLIEDPVGGTDVTVSTSTDMDDSSSDSALAATSDLNSTFNSANDSRISELEQEVSSLTQKNSDLTKQISSLQAVSIPDTTIAWYQEPTFVLVLAVGAVIFLILCVLLMAQNKKLQSQLKFNQGATNPSQPDLGTDATTSTKSENENSQSPFKNISLPFGASAKKEAAPSNEVNSAPAESSAESVTGDPVATATPITPPATNDSVPSPTLEVSSSVGTADMSTPLQAEPALLVTNNLPPTPEPFPINHETVSNSVSPAPIADVPPSPEISASVGQPPSSSPEAAAPAPVEQPNMTSVFDQFFPANPAASTTENPGVAPQSSGEMVSPDVQNPVSPPVAGEPPTAN